MKRKTRFEVQLTELEKLREAEATAEVITKLGTAIGHSNNFIAARAAEIAAHHQIFGLREALVTAYDYFLIDPVKRDAGCLAKETIVKALKKLEYAEAEFFVSGSEYIQMEPVFGGQADTAADLRSNCALALVRMGYADVFVVLVSLLSDSEVQCRLAAIEALTNLSSEKSELLLRFKCQAGDSNVEVLDKCFSSLLLLNFERSIPFVSRFLKDEELAVAEAAALALGESQKLRAYQVLQQRWQMEIAAKYKQMLLLPMALTRQEEAFTFLLDLMATAPLGYALAAIEALKIYKHDAELRRRAKVAAGSHSERGVLVAYRKAFN